MVINSKLAKYSYVVSIKFSSLRKYATLKFYSVITPPGTNFTFPVDKPHLVFGYLVVDSATIVTIPAGAKIYMHNNAVLWVYKDGTLEVLGLPANKVTFQIRNEVF